MIKNMLFTEPEYARITTRGYQKTAVLPEINKNNYTKTEISNLFKK